MQPDAFAGWIIIGRVRAPHGVRGELRVDILTDFPERFNSIKRVYIGEEHAAFAMKGVRFTPKGALLRLNGVETRESAARLSRSYIALPEAEIPPLQAGSFHHHQIVGLEVYASDGSFLGCVADILVTGSNDVYIVRGAEPKEILLPATSEVVQAIDLEGRRITVRLMPGLLPE
jgi:16S rRNA processing protein RimM